MFQELLYMGSVRWTHLLNVEGFGLNYKCVCQIYPELERRWIRRALSLAARNTQ